MLTKYSIQQLYCVSERPVMQELVLDPEKFPDPHNDHPLNQHEDSSWHAYFRVSLQFCHGFALLDQCA